MTYRLSHPEAVIASHAHEMRPLVASLAVALPDTWTLPRVCRELARQDEYRWILLTFRFR